MRGRSPLRPIFTVLVFAFALLLPASTQPARADGPWHVPTTGSDANNFMGPNQPSAAVASAGAGPYRIVLPLIAKPCPTRLSDDFSNPASGWPTWDASVSTGGYVNGEYRILIKQAGYISFATPDIPVSNFHVWVDGRAAGNLNGGYGLVFAYSPAGFYVFEVFDGRFAMIRYDNPGGWAVLVAPAYHPAIRTGNATNRLEIERVGDRILLSANGQLIRSVQDTAHTTGTIGVAADAGESNFDARFDNFVLYDGSCTSVLPVSGTTSVDDGEWASRALRSRMELRSPLMSGAGISPDCPDQQRRDREL